MRRAFPFWIITGVLAAHLLLFWAVAGRHYLPKVPYVPPRPTPNFAGAVRRTTDPRTGEAATETQFVVSTTFATPPARPAPSPGPEAKAK